MGLRNFENAVNTLLIKVIIDEFTSRAIPMSIKTNIVVLLLKRSIRLRHVLLDRKRIHYNSYYIAKRPRCSYRRL